MSLSLVGGNSFMEVVLDLGVFSFGHSLGYICFLSASLHFDSKSVMDESELLKPESVYALRPKVFQFGICRRIFIS